MSETKAHPHTHLTRAFTLEEEGDLRAAETELKKAVAVADALPLPTYKSDYEKELGQYSSDPKYESLPGVGVDELHQTYQNLLSFPFCMRMQLAGFYARNGALPEAAEVCAQAFEVGLDPSVQNSPRLSDMVRRARELQSTIHDILGPENLVAAAERHFEQLDADGDGFIHERELRQALFNLNIDSEGQTLIRHLLFHYFEIEASSNDELGVDINGITRKDLQKFQKQKNSEWRRLKPR